MFEKIAQHFKATQVAPELLASVEGEPGQQLTEKEIADRARQQELRAQLQQRQTSEYFYMIDVVGGCNLRCPSCAVGNYAQTEAKGIMKVDNYEKILEKIASEHPSERVFINLYNWGEPALHKQLATIIDITKRFGFGTGISCNLNTFPDITGVARSAPTYIRISLSGFVNSVYQRNHRRGDINLVKANMHLLRHHLDKSGSQTIVQVGFHVYRSNFPEDFFKMRQLCFDLDFIFAPVLASVMPVEKAIRAVDGDALGPDLESIESNLVIPMKRRMELVAPAREKHSDCQFRKMSTTINFDGSVALCCATYERSQIISDSFLDTNRDELRKRKYKHSFCRECQTRNLDLLYTGSEQQLIDKEAVAVLGSKYQDFLDEWNVSLEPAVKWQGQKLSIQEACDLALRELTAGAVHNTKAIFILVAQSAPDHAEAKFQLGKIAEAEGDVSAALGLYEEAIRLYPGFALYVAQRDSLIGRTSGVGTRSPSLEIEPVSSVDTGKACDMGYAVQSFSHLATLVESSAISGRRVIDLGSQDVKIFNEADYQLLEETVRRFGGDTKRLQKLVAPPYPVMITARDVFEISGFDYACCDVDQRPGTVYVDFNTLAFDRSLYGKFDFVMNAGTTEHLPNPLAAFFLMHHLCCQDGMLFNEVPFSGWTNHGLNNLTAKFWHTLSWMNSYRVLAANIKYVPAASQHDGNFGGKHLAFINNLCGAVEVSSSIEIIFQKTNSRGFVPPYDAVFPTTDGGKAVGQLVMGSLRPFITCGSLTAAQAEKTVNQFLAYQSLPYRYSESDNLSRSSAAQPRSGLGRYLPPIIRNSPAVASIVRAIRKKT